MIEEEKTSETTQEVWPMFKVELMIYDVTGTPQPPKPVQKSFAMERLGADHLNRFSRFSCA